MSTILSLIEACHEGKPVAVAEAFQNLISERVANLIEDEKPTVIREFFDSIDAKATSASAS